MRNYLLLILLLALSACSSTIPGLQREQVIYAFATNAVAFSDRYIVPASPAPWNGVATAATALVSALLAAWSFSHEKRLQKARSDINGHLAKTGEVPRGEATKN